MRDVGIDAVGADVLGRVVGFGGGVAVEAGVVPVPLVDALPVVEGDEDVAVPRVAEEVATLVAVAGGVRLALGV